MDRQRFPELHDVAGAQTSLLIKNLRLLDLDEEFDYPHPQPSTFAENSAADKQLERQQCAQWILYKLLQICDPEATQVTLKPHFPASSLQQSTRLQTELCKCLCQLKEVGVLGKHIRVTASLLQDCRGPGIERLLASLSTEALCHRIISDKDHSSAFCRILRNDASRMRDCAAPLSLAYRHALAAQLRERTLLEKRWRRLDRALHAKAENLTAQEQQTDGSESARKDKKVPRRTIARLRQHLEMNWAGDKRWVDAILADDGDWRAGGMLDKPFTDVWNHATQDTLYAIRDDDSKSLLQDLEARVQIQSSRLEKWKAVRESLVDSPSPNDEAMQASLHDPQRPQGPRHAVMTSQQRVTKPSLEAAPSSPEELDDRMHQPTITGPVTRSKTSAQVARSTADKSSASKENRRPSYHLRSRTVGDVKPSEPDALRSENGLLAQQRLDPTPLADLDPSGNELEAEVGLSESVRFSREAATNTKPLPSLAERTRMSMALMSPLKRDPIDHEEVPMPQSDSARPQSAGRVHLVPETPSTSTLTSAFDTLADRARQSMNITTTRTPAPKRPGKTRTTSVHDTKKAGARRPTQVADDATDTKFLEALEGMDGDYESIFRPRPRVALSPVISPLPGASIVKKMDLNGHGSEGEDDFS